MGRNSVYPLPFFLTDDLMIFTSLWGEIPDVIQQAGPPVATVPIANFPDQTAADGGFLGVMATGDLPEIDSTMSLVAYDPVTASITEVYWSTSGVLTMDVWVIKTLHGASYVPTAFMRTA